MSSVTFGQSNKTESNNKMLLIKNNINFNAGFLVIAYDLGLSYQRLKPHKKLYSVWTFGIDYFQLEGWSTQKYISPSIKYGILTGLETENHFEINAGISLISEMRGNGKNSNNIGLAVNLGYRYQAPRAGGIFRFGIGFPELVYLGFGFSF